MAHPLRHPLQLPTIACRNQRPGSGRRRFQSPFENLAATEHFPGVPIPTLEGEFEGACPLMRVRKGWGTDSHGRGTTTSPMGIRYPIPIPTVIRGVVWRGEVPPSRRSRAGKEEVPPPMTRSNLDRWEDCGDGVQGCPLPHLLLWQKGSVLPFYSKG